MSMTPAEPAIFRGVIALELRDGMPPTQAALTVAVPNAPKPPAERISLGLSVLRSCRHQLVLITGIGKAPALAAWYRDENLPINQSVRSDACLLLDESLRLATRDRRTSAG